MTLLEYCAAKRGRLAHLAKEIGLSPAHLSQIAHGKRSMPAELAAALERASEGVVSRKVMFPDAWMRIWPELVQASPGTSALERQEDMRLNERRQCTRRAEDTAAHALAVKPDASTLADRRQVGRFGPGRRAEDRRGAADIDTPAATA